MEQNVGLEDISMFNNVGSITDEGPHLSDCEEILHDNEEDQECSPLNVGVCGVPSADHLGTEPVQSSVCHIITISNSTYSRQVNTEEAPNKLQTDDSSHGTCSTDTISDTDTLSAQESQSTQVESGENIGVAGSKSTGSIYIDDGIAKAEKPVSKVEQKPKRLTMAQRATMEALASFGGCGLSSIHVRKIDLHSELEEEKEKEKKKRGLECDEDACEEQSPPKKRPRTRLQAAKQEAEKAFENIALADGQKKYSTVQKLKASVSQPQRSSVKERVTRAEKSRREALESFGGATLDSLSAKTTDTESTTTEVEKTSSRSRRHLTRVERARLEALQGFGGSGLQDILSSSKRKIARTLEKEVKTKNTVTEAGNKENLEDDGDQLPVQ